MPSGFKKRLTRLHAARQRLRQPDEPDAQGRVFYADQPESANQDAHPAATDLSPPPASAADAFSAAWLAAGAKTRPTPHGTAHYLVQAHAETTSHGRRQLADGRGEEINESLHKFHNLSRRRPLDTPDKFLADRLAFLDLETNGLSKNSYPFCVGIGLWEEGEFSVYHYLMTAPHDEPAVLAACIEAIKGSAGICTFNGASFDLPMLKRRCEHHQIPHPFDAMAHLDLLPVSRKLFPGRKSHKLSRLEEDLLKFQRHGDIPGAQIPARWKQYLKDHHPEPLLGVFDHNRLDILSMVALLAEFSDALAPPKKPSRRTSQISPPSQSRSASDPPSQLATSLRRSYSLRKKYTDTRPDEHAPRAANQPNHAAKSVQPGPAFTRSQLTQGMPVGAHLRELRADVERALDPQHAPTLEPPVLAKLFEMLAFAPRHPFALEKLVKHYKSTEQTKLAEFFAKRLQDSSPF